MVGVVGGVGVPEGSAVARVGWSEGVVALDVDVFADVWREPWQIVGVDGMAIGLELGDGGVEVGGVPEGDAVEDEAEGAELVFHSFSVGLPELAFAAVEDVAGEVVAAFLEVAHLFDLPPVGLAFDESEDVQGFEDSPVTGDGFTEPCGFPFLLSIRTMSCALTAPVWIEPTIRKMSGQCRAITVRLMMPRAMVSSCW